LRRKERRKRRGGKWGWRGSSCSGGAMLGGASSANSVTEWWGGLPMGTRLVFGLNALVYVAGLCVPRDWTFSAARAPASFCMYPRVIWAHPDQWYRIFTSAFVHGGLMHIGFNMVGQVEYSR